VRPHHACMPSRSVTNTAGGHSWCDTSGVLNVQYTMMT
jgi:hypothetical protein